MDRLFNILILNRNRPSVYPKEEWEQISPGLHGSVASVYQRYNRDVPPVLAESSEWHGTGWRGERVNIQLVLWTATGCRQAHIQVSDLVNKKGNKIISSAINPAFVRYTLGYEEVYYKTQPGKQGRQAVIADIIDTQKQLDIPAESTRPLWISIDIPRSAAPGKYTGALSVSAEGGIKTKFSIDIEVLPISLTPAKNWSFYLDLWQNPFSVAEYHQVEMWSEAHFILMEPLYKRLANAGQKCITTSIVHQPWGSQTYRHFDSMIKWVKKSNGNWDYDFSIFDKYVEFCIKCGISERINCYSMVPWTNAFRYFDEISGDYKSVIAKPGEPAYMNHWRSFLKSFSIHLRQKGWLEKTSIALDERSEEMMLNMMQFMNSVAPELQIASAVNYHTELTENIYDLCVIIQHTPDEEIIQQRVNKGLPTTYYVCTSPEKPNTFTNSPPAEATWIGWFAAAKGYSGFLRWAYNSWTKDPLHDTRYVRWPAGDCFLVYPGNRSSIRFEMLRDGIEDYEKIRMLKSIISSDGGDSSIEDIIEESLSGFTYESVYKVPAKKTVTEARELLLNAARLAIKKEQPFD